MFNFSLRLICLTFIVAHAAPGPLASPASNNDTKKAPSAVGVGFTKHVVCSGDVQAIDSVIITVPNVWRNSNLAVSYMAPEGSIVESGQILLQFDESEMRRQELEFERAYEGARSDIARKAAELDSDRQDILIDQAAAVRAVGRAELYSKIDPQLLSGQDRTRYQYELETARVELKKVKERLQASEVSAEAQLELSQLAADRSRLRLERLRAELQKLTIRAPISGLVNYGDNPERGDKIQVGDSLWTGFPVVYLPDMTGVRIKTYVYEPDYALVAPGMSAEITMDAYPSRIFSGRIVALPEIARPRGYRYRLRAFPVDIVLDDPDPRILKPGMSARVRIPISVEDGLTVPRAAVAFEPDGRSTVLPEGARERVEVQILDGNHTSFRVSGPLQPGAPLRLTPSGSIAEVGSNRLDWIPVDRNDLVFSVNGSGIIEASKAVSIAPPVLRHHWEFKIISMVPEGEVVKTGDALIAFDPSEARTRLREENAELEKIQKENERTRATLRLQVEDLELKIEEARVTRDRAESKLGQAKEFEPVLKVREAELDFELAARRLLLLEAKLESVKKSVGIQLDLLEQRERLRVERIGWYREALSSLTVTSPAAGMVLYKADRRNRKKEIGSKVYPKEIVMFLPDPESLSVRGQVAEADAGKLEVGQIVNISVDAIPDLTLRGRVTEIARLITRAASNRPLRVLEFKVRFEDLFPESMRPGMAARLEVIVEQFKDVVAVPLAAIDRADDGFYATVEEGDRLVRKRIEIRSHNGVVAVVESGLEGVSRIAAVQGKGTR